MFYEVDMEIYKKLLRNEEGEWLISYEQPSAPFFVDRHIVTSYTRIEAPKEYVEAKKRDRIKSKAEIRRLDMINELISQDIYITDKEKRQKIAEELAKKYETTSRRLLRIYYRFLARGFIMEKKIKNVPVERQNNYKNFDWAIRTYYYSAKKMSLQSAYDMMLIAKYMDNDGKLMEQCPTFDSFKHFFYDNGYHRRSKKIIAREGLSSYQRNNRPLHGSAMAWKDRIGHYQMDATVADIYLVSRFNKNRVIGRPNIYMAVDTATQMIAGIYVGLESNERAVMLCLANAAEDKVEYCKKFGIDIDKKDWPTEGLPGAVITDQGNEFLGGAMDELCQMYGMETEALPPFRPDDKSLVEKTFDVLQTKYKPLLRGKGVIEKDAAERWATDYRSQAILDLDEFTKIVLRIVIYLNSGRVLESVVLTKEMVEEGISEVSNQLWTWYENQNRSDIIPVKDEDIYRLSLKRRKGKIDRNGILHNGIHYKNKNLGKILENVKNKSNVTIAYDPDSIESIYMLENGEWYEFSLPDEYVEFSRLNEQEFEIAERETRKRRRSLEKDETIKRVATLHEINKIVSDAEAIEKGKQDGKQIKENRENEKERLS